MYSVPDSVATRIKNEFDGRIRVRYSTKRRAFQVEAKTSRALSDIKFPNHFNGAQIKKVMDVFHDDIERHKDGYSLVLEVQPGDRMPCPVCSSTLKVPHLKTAEIRCDYCIVASGGRKDGRVTAGYWPIDSEAFMDRLRYLDPSRSYRKGAKGVDAANAERQAIEEKDAMNLIGSVNRDEYRNFAGILQTGTTTKTGAWTNAPESPLLKALR
jgi:hypothetical protein